MGGSDARALSRSLLDLCRMRKLTIATAESCTGGLVAGALTDIPGSSDVIDRGFVTYSNDAKRAMLGVEASTLANFGAVSKETATAMAVGALERAGVDLAVAITGYRRPRRRHARQAGRSRAFCGCRARRPHRPSRASFWRDWPYRRAPALGGRGIAHADGSRPRPEGAAQAAARGRGNPPAAPRDPLAAPACGEAQDAAVTARLSHVMPPPAARSRGRARAA
ncbi:PncC family amidohydrolase [Bradyrhizobium sp. i1.3.1]